MSENSLTTHFNFNATHNGQTAIESLSPEDQGTERQFRFTASMLAKMFDVQVHTINARIKTLIDTGDLDECKNLQSLNIPNEHGNGAHKTMLYDLTVLNKLAMTMIDSPIAIEVRNKFNDVIVQHEIKQLTFPDSYMIEDPIERAKAWIVEQERTRAALTAEVAKRMLAEEQLAEVETTNSDLTEENAELRHRTHSAEGRSGGLVRANNLLKAENTRLREGLCSAREAMNSLFACGAIVNDGVKEDTIYGRVRYGLEFFAHAVDAVIVTLPCGGTHTEGGVEKENVARFYPECTYAELKNWIREHSVSDFKHIKSVLKAN